MLILICLQTVHQIINIQHQHCSLFIHFRLVLRVAADDPLGAHPFGHKFGCSVEGGKKLLQLCRQLELLVIGVWYT